MDFVNNFINKSQNILLKLKDDLRTIRSGKVNPSLIENLIIETYNNTVKLKLKEVATITNVDPTTLQIKPFDRSTIADIEKAILKSPLSVSPKVESDQIMIKFPPLSQEQREKFIKLIRQRVEESRNNIRKVRDEIRKSIRISLENKVITEDQKFRIEKQIDEETKKIMLEIENLKTKKEEEILTL